MTDPIFKKTKKFLECISMLILGEGPEVGYGELYDNEAHYETEKRKSLFVGSTT